MINIRTGDYFNDLNENFTTDNDIAFVAADGVGTVRMGRAIKGDSLTWTNEGSNTYSATTPDTVGTIIDLDESGDSPFYYKGSSDTVKRQYGEQDSIAEVKGSQGRNFFPDGTTLYIKTHDGRQPDSDVILFLDQNQTSISNKDVTIYMEGIEVWGARPLLMSYSNIEHTAKFVGVDCAFRYSPTGNNFEVNGVNNVRLVRCQTSNNAAGDDGFDYSRNANGINPSCYNLEVDCIGFENGNNSTDNASTMHDDENYIIRVNGIYVGQDDSPAIADVEGAHSLNFGCQSNQSGIGFLPQTASPVSGDTAKMWIKDCYAQGNTIANAEARTGGVLTLISGNVV